MADIFDVVSDPTRRELLVALRDGGEQSVGELVEQLGLTQPTVSKHLRVLRENGLVVVRENGQHRFYRVETSPLVAVEDWLAPFLVPGPTETQAVADDASATVFAAWAGTDVASDLGRRIADGRYQVRSVIQDASQEVQRRLPPAVRERLFKRP
ncbi:MAG TPA: metalloregulator ArsR/SmtB family transcription factor [Rhodoglobus sp.]|nr:metalloregulator ArsR/SmtB family transcription factor [Rhodoglobus sp.]